MKRGQTILLVVIAALLATNLMRSGAEAQIATSSTTPVVVAGTAYQLVGNQGAGGGEHRMWRFWSDGRVDTFEVSLPNPGQTGCFANITCGPDEIVPGTCQADITRDGDIDVDDMLQVLGDWGPCPPPAD